MEWVLFTHLNGLLANQDKRRAMTEELASSGTPKVKLFLSIGHLLMNRWIEGNREREYEGRKLLFSEITHPDQPIELEPMNGEWVINWGFQSVNF